ncbi:MAG: RecX family transcriptional regulator [Proteobacteria bacterium]|nr:RecX family transcriptional regulator [Pseudomonadota bacterium]
MKGIVTDIKYQKRNASRVNIFIDGDYAFSVPLLSASSLKPGQKLSPSEIDAFRHEHDVYKAYSTAIGYLTRSPRSKSEIETHLRGKKFSKPIIEQTIQKLEGNTYINDETYARIFVENRERFHPRSTFALRFELKQKGVKENIINQVLESANDLELAWKAVKGKLYRWQALPENQLKEKILSFLSRRGFNYDIANDTLEKVLDSLKTD